MENIEIRRIEDSSETELMTDWMHGWWGQRENYTREAVRCCMEHSLKREGLPQTYGLYLDGRLIGMYQFTCADLFVRPDIYPWLANVYVDEAHRSKGYGRLLLASVQKSAAESGLDELYLFTEHSGLYEKFGWEFVERIDTHLEPRMQRLYRLRVRQSGI